MKSKILFLHIPKTGGRKINQLLRRFYTEATYIDHIESVKFHKLESILKNKCYISGHYSYSEFKNILGDLSNWNVITFVREPYNQLISHLSWLRNLRTNKSKFGKHSKTVQNICKKFYDIDFSNPDVLYQMVDSMNQYEISLFDNNQLRYLCGPKDKIKLSEADLVQAIENFKGILYCGIFEEFNVSVVELFKKLNLCLNKLDLSNTINSQPKKVIEDIHNKPTIKKILHPLIKYDLKLYNEILSKK